MNNLENAFAAAEITDETAAPVVENAAPEIDLSGIMPEEPKAENEPASTPAAPVYATPYEGKKRGRAAGFRTTITNTAGLFAKELKPLAKNLKIPYFVDTPLTPEEIVARVQQVAATEPMKLADSNFLSTIAVNRKGGMLSFTEIVEQFGEETVIEVKTSAITAFYEERRASAIAKLSTLDQEDIGTVTELETLADHGE